MTNVSSALYERKAAVDLLTQAIEYVRPLLAQSLPIKERCHDFWAGVVVARDLAAVDVIEREFTDLARQTALTRDLGWHGRATVAHLIRWGLLDLNPFDGGRP
jgi:hypothetical protein